MFVGFAARADSGVGHEFVQTYLFVRIHFGLFVFHTFGTWHEALAWTGEGLSLLLVATSAGIVVVATFLWCSVIVSVTVVMATVAVALVVAWLIAGLLRFAVGSGVVVAGFIAALLTWLISSLLTVLVVTRLVSTLLAVVIIAWLIAAMLHLLFAVVACYGIVRDGVAVIVARLVSSAVVSVVVVAVALIIVTRLISALAVLVIARLVSVLLAWLIGPWLICSARLFVAAVVLVVFIPWGGGAFAVSHFFKA